MPRFQVDSDVSLYYEIRGQGPALVLLNGLSQTTANWMTQSRRLAEFFTVVTYDGRGQGKTPIGEREVTPEVLTDDLALLLDHLDIETTHLSGFSYGGQVAMTFAALHPHRVEKLVLTGVGSGNSPLRRLTVRRWAEVLRLGGVEAMAWCAMTDIFGIAFLARYERQANAMVKATIQRNSADGIGRLLQCALLFAPPVEVATQIHASTFLIGGEEDPLAEPACVHELAEHLLISREIVLEKTGHTVAVERPDEWRKLVLDFLQE